MPRGAANSRDWLLYCIIAAASFTSGIWFSRAALPTAGRHSFDESAAAVAARVAGSQEEIARLRAELAVARGQLAPSKPSGNSQPRAAAPRNPLDETFYPTAPDELRELAKSCTVRIDQPELLDSTPGSVGGAAEAMDAAPDEVRVMNDAIRALHASFRSQLRELYAEAMGRPADSELSPRAMLGELRDKRPPEAAGLLATIARERAGELAAPASLAEASAYERAQRLYFALGDEFQNRVAQVLGPERASALRAASGGWKWARSQFTGCEQ